MNELLVLIERLMNAGYDANSATRLASEELGII